MGYFEATHGYVIYSPRATPSVSGSHIPEGPLNNLLISHMDEVNLTDNYKEMPLF